MKKLLLILLCLPMIGLGQYSNSYKEFNGGLYFGGNDLTVFPGISYLIGRTNYYSNNIVMDYEIGFALPTVVTGKVGVGFGSYLALGGLYTIATASGVFAPIYVAAGTVGGVLGGSTIFVTNATKEFREYSGLEKCLEKKGHDVIFYDAKKAKE